jgi:hypothetical protein
MISIEEFKLIEFDFQDAGIDYYPLQQELVGHICTDVEKEIERGKSFDLAYQRIKSQYIDCHNLIEVQSDTKNLLDYKSIFLKRILIALSAITLLGFLLKTYKIPGSNWIQFISILLLGVLFNKIGLYLFRDKRQKNLKKLCSLPLFIAGILLTTAYLILASFPIHKRSN